MATDKDHKFNTKEVEVLTVLYNNPGAQFTTYQLIQMLHPTVDPSSENHKKVFNEVAETTEELLMLDLVEGTRRKDNADRVFFSDLQLNRRGERKAIELKKKKPVIS
jgi:hypothetical protein